LNVDEQAQKSALLRQRMVEDQVRGRGISNERVLRAMLAVPREEFVSEIQRDYAYEDCPLPIGFGQTISQPFTVAFQCAALQLQGHERVLEVGTGSGYAAAVLSHLAKEVYTVERIPELAAQAEATLSRLGYSNVRVFAANGTLGLPAHALFDGIVATAGGNALPQPLVDQLAPGGRIVIPLGELYFQEMFRFTKLDDQLKRESLGGFAFVPLIGRHGWHSSVDSENEKDPF
jgi:protein-L-isoaspartate(D-aspartate) O-methyltransferase